MPAIRPPPPTGTMIASASGASSSTSSAIVPAPARTNGSSMRVDEGAAGLLAELGDALECLARGRRLEVDVAPYVTRRLDLLLGRALPHDDEGVDAVLGRGKGDGLCVVSGGHGDHAAPPLVVVEATPA